MATNLPDIEKTGESDPPLIAPKVFISYSWSSPGHQETVRQWAERLVGDGIDVVLDVYDLKEGQDKYSFMESMVTDPEVTHVLIFCDRAYSEKANSRKAGVGAESLIISSEVYEKVKQSKFIPIVCEYANSEPCLPLFLKSRIWIDFSSPEAANENWERLVRAIYGKPVHQRPELGSPPAYIVDDNETPISPASSKFLDLKRALSQNSPKIKLIRMEFLSACLKYADALRVRERPEVASLGIRVVEDFGKLRSVRNQILDWVILESTTSANESFSEALLEFLEQLIELKTKPSEMNIWNDAWSGAHSLFLYETFLYIVAALLKTRSHKTLKEIFANHYLRRSATGHDETEFSNFSCFHGHSELIQSALASPNRFISPAAELIKRHADREELPFSSLMEAELLTLLMAFVHENAYWYPATLLYSSRAQSKFPFFIKATRHKDFLKLAEITGVESADAIREAFKAGSLRLRVGNWDDFSIGMISFWVYMNMEKLDTLK